MLRGRLAHQELVTRAWQAYFWIAESGGMLIPSDEDAALFLRLIGPMPHVNRVPR